MLKAWHLFKKRHLQTLQNLIQESSSEHICVLSYYSLTYISRSLPEFSSLVENIIENTVLNILMEANCGELNVTAPIYKIAKPPHKALDTDAV